MITAFDGIKFMQKEERNWKQGISGFRRPACLPAMHVLTGSGASHGRANC
jgi:hypothetical protein